ncbi:hypothetical protein OUK_0277 [Helicobacter pylori R037c]|nr:hypothetical protein OUK_0277 [Helicobacter pylori R037c]
MFEKTYNKRVLWGFYGGCYKKSGLGMSGHFWVCCVFCGV